MHITIAKSAGFCFGVRRALAIALKTASTHANVYMLGDIVHNEDVVEQVKQAGIKKIPRISSGTGKVLLIRAHGAGTTTYQEAKRQGYRIIDATCPMVKEIHAVARKMEARGYPIIIIGDKNHDEVKGIAGQLRSTAILIDNPKRIPWGKVSRLSKACVVVQSTQNINTVLAIVDSLKKKIKNLIFSNTICRPTTTKQQEMRRMPLVNDVMIVVGSKSSANTRRLYEISKKLNKRTYWVNAAKELRQSWFKGIKNVGITAGASTPDQTIQSVASRITSF